MKHGTIVRNLWQPGHDSFLVYMGVSGRYARVIWLFDGKLEGIHRFYKSDILNDREHFPVVGYVNYEKVLTDAIKNGVGKMEDEG